MTVGPKKFFFLLLLCLIPMTFKILSLSNHLWIKLLSLEHFTEMSTLIKTLWSCVRSFKKKLRCVLMIEIHTNKYYMQCLEMIESYAQSFKNLSNQMPTWMMCENMWLCNKNMSRAVQQLNKSKCLKGSEYWCASSDNAKECKVIIKFILPFLITQCHLPSLWR